MTIGIVGCGKMGSALTLGALKANIITPSQLLAFDPNPQALASLGSEITAADSLDSLITQCDTLLLCVKPHHCASVLEKVALAQRGPDSLLIISIAAGLTIATLEAACQNQARVIRSMPNTPALIGQGAAAFSRGTLATPRDAEFTSDLLSSVGIAHEVPESLLDAVTGLSGSGPAYVYTFIESLTDAGVREGIPRSQALELATQTVIGAAQMIAQSGEHPAVLRDQVTSPGGTTIAALAALEKHGFRHATFEAVHTAAERARQLGQPS